jgi:hypothetical protein
VLYPTGITQRELYGASYRVKENITPADPLARTQHVIGKEQDLIDLLPEGSAVTARGGCPVRGG